MRYYVSQHLVPHRLAAPDEAEYWQGLLRPSVDGVRVDGAGNRNSVRTLRRYTRAVCG